MLLYAIICYAVAAAAETGGLILILVSLRENRSILRTWVGANPNQNDQGSWGQILELNGVVMSLLDTGRMRSRAAAALIAIGILAGTLGNFTGLPS